VQSGKTFTLKMEAVVSSKTLINVYQSTQHCLPEDSTPQFNGVNESIKVILFMKQQFVITLTIRQTEIPALLDSWVTNTPSVKMLCPQKKKLLAIIFS
jgi:hypothetical protein